MKRREYRRKEIKERVGERKENIAWTCEHVTKARNLERDMDILNITPPDQNQSTKIELDFSLLKKWNPPEVPSKGPFQGSYQMVLPSMVLSSMVLSTKILPSMVLRSWCSLKKKKGKEKMEKNNERRNLVVQTGHEFLYFCHRIICPMSDRLG